MSSKNALSTNSNIQRFDKKVLSGIEEQTTAGLLYIHKQCPRPSQTLLICTSLVYSAGLPSLCILFHDLPRFVSLCDSSWHCSLATILFQRFSCYDNQEWDKIVHIDFEVRLTRNITKATSCEQVKKWDIVKLQTLHILNKVKKFQELKINTINKSKRY